MKGLLKYIIVITSFVGISFHFVDIIFNEYLSGVNELFVTLSYFTVQSNIIVFVYFLLMIIPGFKKGKTYDDFFGGVFSYIFITGFVFITILEAIYNPPGYLLVSSILNHYVTPLLVIAYYYFNKGKYSFTIKHIYLWMIYPLEYVVFIIGIGLVYGSYLYPFLEVSEIGLLGVIASMVVIGGFFVGVQYGIVRISKKYGIKKYDEVII